MAATLTQSSLSTQYIQVLITVTSPSPYDPTDDAVQFAFWAGSTTPTASQLTWNAGSWAVFPGPAYWAQCLVGPGSGGVNLAPAFYQVWVMITSNPEVPVMLGAYLNVI